MFLHCHTVWLCVNGCVTLPALHIHDMLACAASLMHCTVALPQCSALIYCPCVLPCYTALTYFQGAEKEVVILATTTTNPHSEFCSDAARLNVALTRARRHLAVVGSAAVLSQVGCMYWQWF